MTTILITLIIIIITVLPVILPVTLHTAIANITIMQPKTVSMQTHTLTRAPLSLTVRALTQLLTQTQTLVIIIIIIILITVTIMLMVTTQAAWTMTKAAQHQTSR